MAVFSCFAVVCIRSRVIDERSNPMDHLNQPATDTTIPTTIAPAFEQWLELEQQ